MHDVDVQVAEWRAYVSRRATIAPPDIDELEGHLRDQVDDLVGGGLAEDEAFLVAVKRLGSIDAISREFAREHSERLWKQLVLSGSDDDTDQSQSGLAAALVLAVAAAVAVRLPMLLGAGWIEEGSDVYVRNLGLFALPFLALYFGLQRRMSPGAIVRWLIVPVLVMAVAINAYPFAPDGQTLVLAALHLPVALWFVVGIAYASGEWRSPARRMDFVRFSGEWAIYYTLIALGGGVLVGLSAAAFSMVGLPFEDVMFEWVLSSGAMGAVLVAAWLVEAKQSVVENMAPVLTRIFTPLTTIMLVALLIATLVAGRPSTVSRDLLIIVDVVLVLVLGLVLYAISARDPLTRSGVFDQLQLALLVVALAVNAVMLSMMVVRIADGGLTANKVAALGLNVILLLNLAWTAWLSWGFVRGKRPFADIERWQLAYLPVFAIWAAFVVLVMPPLFAFG